MVEVMLFVNVGLLVIGSVTLTIAVFVVLKARGYVEIAERRLERLREGQERLFLFLREERQLRNGRARARQYDEHAVEGVPPRGEERDFERIARLEWEIQDLRRAAQKTASGVKSGGRPGVRDKGVALIDRDEPRSGVRNGDVASIEMSRNETYPGRAAEPPTAKSCGFAVGHAHPDDDVSLRRTISKASGASDKGARSKIFLEHYHRYLENYEGYVKLAERLYRMKEAGEVPAGSPAEREWEQRLRRLQDGIRRTTARLDILEQYNPELASDERVSHRAEIARRYSELERKLTGLNATTIPFLS